MCGDVVGDALQLRVGARVRPPPLVGAVVGAVPALALAAELLALRNSRPAYGPAAVLASAEFRVPRDAQATQHAMQTPLELRVDGAPRFVELAGVRVNVRAVDDAVHQCHSLSCPLGACSQRL